MKDQQARMARLLALADKQQHGMRMRPLCAMVRRMFLRGLPQGWGK